MQDIKISEILDDLNRGLSRSPKSSGYKPEIGSVQEKYNLTNKEVTYLFKLPQLKGVRKGDPVRINIIDDTQEGYVENTSDESTESDVPNSTGLTAEHFDNPWEEEIRKAKEIARLAVTNLEENN